MKTASKRLLSLALVLCMLLSFSVAAFAEGDAEKSVYTVLGDSNSVGCGLYSYYHDGFRENMVHEGSYAQIVGDALCADINCDGHCGWRTVEILRCLNYALGRDYTPDEYSDMFITCIGLNFLVETGVSVILSTAVSRLVIYFGKRNRNITE